VRRSARGASVDSVTLAPHLAGDAEGPRLSNILAAGGETVPATSLTAAGKSTTSARSMVARWAKAHGDGPVHEALISAVGRAEPISWIEKRLRDRSSAEDEARALSRARGERYRREVQGPPPEVLARMHNARSACRSRRERQRDVRARATLSAFRGGGCSVRTCTDCPARRSFAF